MASRRIPITCIVAMCLIAFAPLAAAEEGDKLVRFGLVYSSPTDDLTVAGTTTEADSALGFHAGVEFMITDVIGVVPAIQFLSYDVESESGSLEVDLGSIDFIELTGSVNFHVVRNDSLDFFVGPTLGYALTGDLEGGALGDFKSDDEFIYGFTAGIDVPFGEGPWAFNAGMNYLLSEIVLEGATEDIGVDPFELKVGLAYSF